MGNETSNEIVVKEDLDGMDGVELGVTDEETPSATPLEEKEQDNEKKAVPPPEINNKGDGKRFKDLWPLFLQLNSFFIQAEGFRSFMLRYIFLTFVQLSLVVVVVVVSYVVRIDPDDIFKGRGIWILIVAVAVAFALGMIAKPLKTGLPPPPCDF